MKTKLRITKILACLGALAGFVGVNGLAVAEDNCSGTWVRVGTAVVTLNDDHNAPSHMAVGVCSPSPSTGTFRCTYKDADGDFWTNETSLRLGKWKTISGTGKYKNAKPSGWTKVVKTESGRPEGKIYIGVWGGECSLPRALHG